MNNSIKLGIAAMAVGAFTGVANAIPSVSMSISDGTTVLVADNSVKDKDPLTGEILFQGTVGGWKINSYFGQGSSDSMDITFNAVPSKAGLPSLVLSFQETGLNLVQPWNAGIGATSQSSQGNGVGSVQYSVNGGSIYSALINGPSGNLSVSGLTTPVGPLSQLTQTITISDGISGATGYKNQSSSGDAYVGGSPVPDGGLTIALLGFGILGVEGIRRRLVK